MTLYTGGSDGFVSSTAAPIASGWSEPSSRVGLSPTVDQRLFTAHVQWRYYDSSTAVSRRLQESYWLDFHQDLQTGSAVSASLGSVTIQGGACVMYPMPTKEL